MLHHKRMPYRRLGTLLLTAGMLSALLTGCGKNKDGDYPGSSKGDVIATYKDGGKVTATEYDKYAAAQAFTSPDKAMYMQIEELKENFVKQYIVSKVLAPQISDADKKTVNDGVDEFEKQLKAELDGASGNQLKSYLDESKLSAGDVAKIYKHDYSFRLYYINKVNELKPNVTEDELKAQYDKDPSAFNVATVRHILIKATDPTTQQTVRTDEEALKIAKDVKAKLDAGGDWNALAKEFSEDDGSKDNGGLYENAEVNGWVQGFKDAANTQEIGVIGDPVQTEFGYHVIKVESRTATAFDKLTDANKDTLKSVVAQTKTGDFLTAEQDKLGIKVTLPAPAESPSASPSASPSVSPSASAK
ncbi:peptidylprolyl isomerase [Cohnella panacarvi]|uniref:peptidylprolyl isomerase n=1 Tax=Cohnella panacarvi TaxID=400776 RepID=UPI00047CC434|nr:peptidylprolyl isomerase [Cohnella panacarvi]